MSFSPVTVAVRDLTSPGTFTADQLRNMVWTLRYQALYHYNRSPWVEHGYAASVADVILVTETRPDTWNIELLDTSDQEGALGYHEDQAFDAHSSGPRKTSERSSRGLAAHNQKPLAKVFCKTSKEDGVQPSEVASHELLEMLVDPRVVNEAEILKYLDSTTKQFYIGEVCDAVQEEGYDVGEPEGRPTGVPEAFVANFVNPGWFRAQQTRPELDFRGTRKAPFELAPGGYMSVAPEDNPGNWTQIYGAKKSA